MKVHKSVPSRIWIRTFLEFLVILPQYYPYILWYRASAILVFQMPESEVQRGQYYQGWVLGKWDLQDKPLAVWKLQSYSRKGLSSEDSKLIQVPLPCRVRRQLHLPWLPYLWRLGWYSTCWIGMFNINHALCLWLKNSRPVGLHDLWSNTNWVCISRS